MTPSRDMRYALKVTKALAYGQATLGDAKKAWKPFDGKWAYVRRYYGALHVALYEQVMGLAFCISTWPLSDAINRARRAKEQADLCALLKATLALIEGDISPPSTLSGTSPASGARTSTVLDFKSLAAGEREVD